MGGELIRIKTASENVTPGFTLYVISVSFGISAVKRACWRLRIECNASYHMSWQMCIKLSRSDKSLWWLMSNLTSREIQQTLGWDWTEHWKTRKTQNIWKLLCFGVFPNFPGLLIFQIQSSFNFTLSELNLTSRKDPSNLLRIIFWVLFS